MIAPRAESYRPLATVLITLVALCWVALVVWGQSPYGRFLGHEALADLHGEVGPQYLMFASVFLAAWVVMTVAMMLPTAIPLVLLFGGFTARRRDAAMLTALLIAGYVVVWALFGAGAHLADLGIHTAVAHSQWLQGHAGLIAAGAFFIAGLYQLTPLKDFCIKKCRSPYQFIVQHWHGQTPKTDALRLGMHHGLFCVGCCWSLMFLMFAVGMGNLAWMVGLAAIMAVEKNMPWGRRLSAPLGVGLLAISIVLAFGGAGSTAACAHDGGPCPPTHAGAATIRQV
jgi:predicted metal-binding membrane protein